MTREQAQSLRTARDTDARLLSRKPKFELAAIERHEAGRPAGETRGRWSKDELITAILERRGFGIEKVNESTHVLYHQPGEKWSACKFCICQETWTAPSGLVTGGVQLVQCVLDPGHRGFCRDDQGRERDGTGTAHDVDCGTTCAPVGHTACGYRG